MLDTSHPALLVSVPSAPTCEHLRLAAAFLAGMTDRALAAQTKTAATPDDVTAVDAAALLQALPPERLQLVAGLAAFLADGSRQGV